MTAASTLGRTLIVLAVLVIAAQFGQSFATHAAAGTSAHHVADGSGVDGQSFCETHGSADDVTGDGSSRVLNCCSKTCTTMLVFEAAGPPAHSHPLLARLRPGPEIQKDGRGPSGLRRPPR